MFPLFSVSTSQVDVGADLSIYRPYILAAKEERRIALGLPVEDQAGEKKTKAPKTSKAMPAEKKRKTEAQQVLEKRKKPKR